MKVKVYMSENNWVIYYISIFLHFCMKVHEETMEV